MEASVCIILVNYNSISDTRECVGSLLGIEYENFNVVIVDNDSNDSEELKNDKFLNRHAEILYLKENGGFSSGNNAGIRYALKKYSPDYIMLLNNDTVVRSDFLKILVDVAEKRKGRAGLVTGCICYYDDRRKIDYRGGFYDRETGITRYRPVDRKTKKVMRVTFATGALWLVPAGVIEKIGFMDESYFMYSEDTDYCNRIIDAGYNIYYADNARIYHKISASSGGNTPFRQYYIMRNDLYNVKKYSTNKLLSFTAQIVLPLYNVIEGRVEIRPVLDAWVDFLRGIKGKSGRY